MCAVWPVLRPRFSSAWSAWVAVREFLEGKARNLGDDVINGRLEASRGFRVMSFLIFVEQVSDGKFGGNFSVGKPVALRDQPRTMAAVRGGHGACIRKYKRTAADRVGSQVLPIVGRSQGGDVFQREATVNFPENP